jgi:HYD1 signature containing ADP-ribosyltransferase
MNPNADTAETPQTLYHYTSPEGQAGILQSQSLNPSLQPPNIVYGTGQYLTDIVPEQIVGRIRADLTQDQVDQGSISFSQLARRLYGQPWGLGNKLSRFLEIDVSGLAVENPAPNIFLIRGTEPLDLFSRIIRFGRTPFAP